MNRDIAEAIRTLARALQTDIITMFVVIDRGINHQWTDDDVKEFGAKTTRSMLGLETKWNDYCEGRLDE